MSQRREPGELYDYEKARKRRQRNYKIKQILWVLAIVLVLGIVLYLNDLLVSRNVTTQIGEFVESIGGSGYPVKRPGGTIIDTKPLGKNLAFMNDTNLYVYNPKGKRLLAVQQMSERSVMQTNAERILVYHQGDNQFRVYSSTGELFSKELEDGIIVGSMGQNGDIAIVSAARQFVAEINVFNRDFDWMMTVSASDHQVTAVDISPKGNQVIVGYATTSGGVLQSIVKSYDVATGLEEYEMPLSDQLVLDLHYQPDGGFSVLTDTQFVCYTPQGEVKGSYAYPAGYELRIVEEKQGKTLLYYRDNRTEQGEFVFLDGEAQPLATLGTTQRVLDVVISTRYIYILTGDKLLQYDKTFQLQQEMEILGAQVLECVQDTVYLFTKNTIEILEET